MIYSLTCGVLADRNYTVERGKGALNWAFLCHWGGDLKHEVVIFILSSKVHGVLLLLKVLLVHLGTFKIVFFGGTPCPRFEVKEAY